MEKKFFYNLASVFIVSCALTIVLCTFKNTYYATNSLKRISYYVSKISKVKTKISGKDNSDSAKENTSKVTKDNLNGEYNKEGVQNNSEEKSVSNNETIKNTKTNTSNKNDMVNNKGINNTNYSVNSIRNENSEKVILRKASENLSSREYENREMDNYLLFNNNIPQMDRDIGVENPDISDILGYEDVPVFKVHHSKIKKSLTISDYGKIYKIARKLNIRDFMKVKDNFEAKDQEQGILNALYLLKEKLSEKDYEEVRAIANKFVDMNVVEQGYKSR